MYMYKYIYIDTYTFSQKSVVPSFGIAFGAAR